ncbi:MAG: glycosyltransferase, partial [Saprospiraceae bacterium]|nr:glycosyltransferase [Saprospiraceae bacterium]
CQVIATKIKKSTGIKWIADLRDPWVDAFWESNIQRIPFSQKIFENQEKKTFQSADFIITATDSFKNLFEKKYNLSNIETLTNGYDLTDFVQSKNLVSSNKFVISYTGSIAESQNPISFFKSISKIPIDLKSEVTVDLYGAVDPSVLETIDENNLNDIVSYKGYITHDKVIDVMHISNLLMLLIPENRGDIIPGKLFEYMASGNSIISFGPEGDASKIIHQNDFGRHFEFNEDCSQFLIDEITTWKRNQNLEKKVPPEKYSRQNLTMKLVSIMNKTIA